MPAHGKCSYIYIWTGRGQGSGRWLGRGGQERPEHLPGNRRRTNGGDGPPGASWLWSEHGEATPPGPCRDGSSPLPTPLPFLVTLPVIRIHLGHPFKSWLSGAPSQHLQTGNQEGSRPRSVLVKWAWLVFFSRGHYLGPSTYRPSFSTQILLITFPLFTLKKAFGSPLSKAGASGGGTRGPGAEKLVAGAMAAARLCPAKSRSLRDQRGFRTKGKRCNEPSKVGDPVFQHERCPWMAA